MHHAPIGAQRLVADNSQNQIATGNITSKVNNRIAGFHQFLIATHHDLILLIQHPAQLIHNGLAVF